jgi:hypothetical protein
MEDHGDNSKSGDSSASSRSAKAAEADSKAKAPVEPESPTGFSTAKSDAPAEQNIEAEKGQLISLRVVRQATQLKKTEEQEPEPSEPAETELKPARAWAMREDNQTKIPANVESASSSVVAGPQEPSPQTQAATAAVAAQAQPSVPAPEQPHAPAPAADEQTQQPAPTLIQPKVAKPRAPKPQTAMPLVSGDDGSGTETSTADPPARNDHEEEPPLRSSTSAAASRQLEAAMAASRESQPGESRSDRLEALANGLKWSPPRLPIPAILGLVVLTLGAMLMGFLMCCNLTNVQIDFSDNNNSADGTRSRLIFSPPFIRFVPRNSTPIPLDQTTTAKVEQQPPSNPPADTDETSKQAPPTSNPPKATDNQPSSKLDNGNNPTQSTDNRSADIQSPSQQPQPVKPATVQVQTLQRTSPANPLRPRQAYQMNSTPTVVRPRHAYEMKQLPPEVVRHAYRTSDKQTQPR